MRLLVTLLAVSTALGCLDKKDEATTGASSRVTSTATSTVIAATQSYDSDNKYPLVGQSSLLNLTITIPTLSNTISIEGLPSTVEYAGGSFPGEGGTCTLPFSGGDCLVVLSYSPTFPEKKVHQLSVVTDNQTYEASLTLESRFLFGHDSYEPSTMRETTFSYRSKVITIGGKMIMADDANNRVLIWNTIPTSTTRPDVVLGQRNFYDIAANNGGISSSSLFSPRGLTSDGTRLIVTDTGNNRVLIWNSIPTANFTAADLVLGQPDFTTSNPHSKHPDTSRSSFSPSYGVTTNGTQIFISDNFNNRVLGWSTFPTSNGTLPDIVIGQADFTQGEYNRGNIDTPANNTLRHPGDVLIFGTRLAIADSSNHRLLIYNTIPTPAQSGTATPDILIGQDEYDERIVESDGSSSVGPSAQGLHFPYALTADSNHLWLADRSNERILRFPISSLANFMNADLVLGQANFSTDSANGGSTTNSSGFDFVQTIFTDGTKFYVMDADNNRLLVWDSIPSSNNAPADYALGQPNLVSKRAKLTETNATTLFEPIGVLATEDKIYISDTKNNRVIGWSNLNTLSSDPDILLGQTYFTTDDINRGLSVAQNSFYEPNRISKIGDEFYLADYRNTRLLQWAALPASSDLPSLVLGEPDFVTASSASTATKFRGSLMSCSHGDNLLIADHHGRVLIYPTKPSTSGAAAAFALGQASTSDSGGNTGGLSASSLWNPSSVACPPDKVVVADRSNNRVLIWNSIPNSNHVPADVVLGQPDFTSGTQNNGGVTASSLNYPTDVVVVDNRLIVTDSHNNRILIWDRIPNLNQQPADHVIGQENFESAFSGYSEENLQKPRQISVINGVIYIADTGNDRVIGMALPEPKN